MTMAALMANPTPPQHSLNQPMIDSSSSTLKESMTAKLSINYANINSFHPPNVLRKIPTRILQPTTVDDVINLLVNNDGRHPTQTECKYSALECTFLKEWDAFYNEFVASKTHALAQSSAATLLSSVVVDDDD